MRFAFAAVCLLLAATGSVRAADVEFVRVWPGWRDAESFERISEYISGRENTGRATVLRSRSGERGGYYFMARVKNSAAALADAKFSLQVIAPDNPVAKAFTFPATLPAGTTIFHLGLTGADWADPKAQPVAWKLELVRADGQVLATSKSFLWEKPAK
jgi:hypothetical protein